MGGTGNPISTGPFDEWGIERSLGSGTLPTREDVETVLSLTPFSTFTARFKGIHGAPHNWIGGTMARIDSPADPVFWLHHANIDRIWAQWQALHPEQVHPALDEPLHPWATTTQEVLDHYQLGYMYDTESAIADPRFSNLVFDGVRVGEAITQPIVFSIRSCVTETVTLEIVDGPTVKRRTRLPVRHTAGDRSFGDDDRSGRNRSPTSDLLYGYYAGRADDWNGDRPTEGNGRGMDRHPLRRRGSKHFDTHYRSRPGGRAEPAAL